MASPDDLWLIDFGDPYPGEPAHHRPALILGPPATFGPTFPFAIVVPLTTSNRGLSLHVEVEPDIHNGLTNTSYIQGELIRSVNRRRFIHRLGTLDPQAALAVRGIVKTLLNVL